MAKMEVILMKNVAKEVQSKIRELIDTRNQTVTDLLEKIEEERRAEAAAQEEIDKATAALDFEMNHKAQQDKAAAAERRILMQRRLDQMNGRKQVTETESEEVIASLLQYEKDLETAFTEDVSTPLAALEKICKDYREKVRETENTINDWTREIHPNYRSQSTRYADGTNRAPHPVPVHVVAFYGCDLSGQIDAFLQKVLPIKK